MIYVTDTHPLVFYAAGSLDRLSARCTKIFRRAEQGRDRVHVPSVCFFEMAMLMERGRIRSDLGFDGWYALVTQQPGFQVEPLLWEDVREARALAALVDPFDRLIAGTAVRIGASLLTNDERIRTSSLISTVW
jgi:PIN domain nuclease of toxin-antitoxin system